jgi:hypothetical protein
MAPHQFSRKSPFSYFPYPVRGSRCAGI